jgi:hypothetical protein
MSKKTTANVERLGLDIGRVITSEPTDGLGPTMFMDDFLNTPPAEGCFEAIADFRNKRFGDEIYLVSKCGPKMQQRTVDWLGHWNFYGETGVTPSNLHFCREYAEKNIIASRLRLTHFVDDRLNVLNFISPQVERILFVPPSDLQVLRHSQIPEGILVARGWPGVRRLLEVNA